MWRQHGIVAVNTEIEIFAKFWYECGFKTNAQRFFSRIEFHGMKENGNLQPPGCFLLGEAE